MKNKNTIITAAVVILLLGLAYLQFRTWHNFNWTSFWNISKDTDPVTAGVTQARHARFKTTFPIEAVAPQAAESAAGVATTVRTVGTLAAFGGRGGLGGARADRQRVDRHRR